MRVIDLFAGCGGMTEGFKNAGFDSVFAVEWERSAAATFVQNFGGHVEVSDITSLPDTAFPDAEVVVGGPPCQGFSNLGNRERSDPRNVLWREYARVVSVSQPKVFVLENVPQFLTSDQFEIFKSWTEHGPLEGYSLAWGVVNSADHGVPQRRRRAIVIGSSTGEASLPAPSHGSVDRPWATVRTAFEGIPFETGPSSLPDRTLESGIPGPFKANEIHMSRNPTELSLRRYDHVPPGGSRFDVPRDLLPDCWLNKPSGTTDVMGRLEWDKPSLTIRTEFFKPEKGRYLHPQWEEDPTRRVNRVISHWEAARLQTFPDSFAWCGSKVEIARQIGNAVPPQLAESLARHIRPLLGA